MTTATPIIRAAGEGEQTWFLGGGLHTWKATAEETNGLFAAFEDTMAQGKTTPLHRHDHHDEAVYLLEGELLLQVEGEDHAIEVGAFFVVPRGVEHALLVTSPTARLLAIVMPGSAEAFFRSASGPAAADADIDGPVDFDEVRRAAEKTGAVEILGPPPFASAASGA